jgi:hypothetical protein
MCGALEEGQREGALLACRVDRAQQLQAVGMVGVLQQGLARQGLGFGGLLGLEGGQGLLVQLGGPGGVGLVVVHPGDSRVWHSRGRAPRGRLLSH